MLPKRGGRPKVDSITCGLVEGSVCSGICAAHFGAGLLGREHPFQVCAGKIALALAGGDFPLEIRAGRRERNAGFEKLRTGVFQAAEWSHTSVRGEAAHKC